ncbi:MAG: TlyA family rRNA (cytidine-2'-O)-methyltransferase, partial [Clostridia bacterium]|nr:TlyA family rRNA (cytidine-2'-O)-methyltransferase [Clostridia bacterium]
LIKPQFECGKQSLASGGICKDKKVHIKVISELFECSKKAGLFPTALTRSPITGGDGNTEYLVCFIKNGEQKVFEENIKSCVMEGQQ